MADDTLATLKTCNTGCKCPTVDYKCIYSCTYTKLKFNYPDGYKADDFESLFIVIANNFEVDTTPLLYANSIDSPTNFDLENNLLIFNSFSNPCELCLDGGEYVYELTGNLKTNEVGDTNAQKILMIQHGKLCLLHSLRQSINKCPE